MTNITEAFIKNSENPVSVTLSEAGAPIAVSPTEISISFYEGYSLSRVLEITRTPTGDGVAFSSGVVTITPIDLTEDLSVLKDGRLYRAKYVVKTASQGTVVFGGNDSDNVVCMLVSTAPA